MYINIYFMTKQPLHSLKSHAFTTMLRLLAGWPALFGKSGPKKKKWQRLMLEWLLYCCITHNMMRIGGILAEIIVQTIKDKYTERNNIHLGVFMWWNVHSIFLKKLGLWFELSMRIQSFLQDSLRGFCWTPTVWNMNWLCPLALYITSCPPVRPRELPKELHLW